MSSITILATLALAMPMNDRAPVWSVMTPTLMDCPFAVDAAMARTPLETSHRVSEGARDRAPWERGAKTAAPAPLGHGGRREVRPAAPG